MNLKKSIFSYIVWAIFAPLCCLEIVFALNAAGITEVLGWPLAVVNGGVCVYLLFLTAVFFALRTLLGEAAGLIKNRRKAEIALSVVLPVLILIGAAAYLVLYLVCRTPLTLEDDSFYRQAVVSAGNSVPFSVHGTLWLYPSLLHMMLLVFGNTPFAGVVLQIVLFFICLLFLYIGMQAFAGTVPAAVSMAAFAFLPVSLQYVFSLTPELFFLTLYLAGFCLAGTLCRKFRQCETSPALDIWALLLGIYIGFLIYLDLYSLSLYFFLAVLYSVDRKKRKQAFVTNLLAVLGGAAGFLLSVTAAFMLGNMTFSGYLEELLAFYTRDVGFEIELLESALLLPDVTFPGILLLISPAFFIIPGFFVWKRAQNSAFLLNLFLAYGLSVSSVFRFDAQMILTLAWCILAGLGIYGVIRRSEPEEESMMVKETEKDEMTKESGEKEMAKEGDKISEREETPAEKKQEQDSPAPGKPLHNPLPVPKKKKHSAADFGYAVKEEDMKFDVEVREDDDFDL